MSISLGIVEPEVTAEALARSAVLLDDPTGLRSGGNVGDGEADPLCRDLNLLLDSSRIV